MVSSVMKNKYSALVVLLLCLWTCSIKLHSGIFSQFLRATACNATVRLCYGRGVLPSVCPSHCCIVSKRRNWGSWNLHCV